MEKYEFYKGTKYALIIKSGKKSRKVIGEAVKENNDGTITFKFAEDVLPNSKVIKVLGEV